MKNKCLAIMGCIAVGMISQVACADSVIACPNLSIKQYGKSHYHEPKTGRIWTLSWLNKRDPVWEALSIPHTVTCGIGKAPNGVPVMYRCTVLQCNSVAVIATLGQTKPLKCFSAYISTQNKFYCDSFSTG